MVAIDADVGAYERRQSGDVGVEDRVALGAQGVECAVDVVGAGYLTLAAVEDPSRQVVAAFGEVGLVLDLAPAWLVVDQGPAYRPRLPDLSSAQ